MKKFLFISIGYLLVFYASAQGWEKALGNSNYQDRASCIAELGEDGFIVGGWSYGTDSAFGKPGNYIVKLDKKGNVEWNFTMNNSVYTQVHDIIVSSDGGYIVSSSSAGYAYLIKLDYNGNLLWEKSPSAPNLPLKGTSIVESNDGGFVFTGKINYGGGNFDAYLYKVDLNGDSVWYTTIGDINYQNGIKLIKVNDGYVVSGEFSAIDDKAFIAKVDFDGNLLWEKNYGSKIYSAQSIVVDHIGDFYISGGFVNDSVQNLFIMKLNSLGDSIWRKSFYRPVPLQNQDLTIDDSGNLVVLCNSVNENSYDVEILKINTNGDSISSKFYGGGNFDYAYQLVNTYDGGVAFVGQTYSYGFNDGQMYIVRTDANGNAFSNYIAGNVFQDNNTNCIKDINELGLHRNGNQYWQVKIVPGPFGNEAYYSSVNQDGSYHIPCDTGSYTVAALPINNLWSSTCSNRNVHFTNFYQNQEDVDFGFNIKIYCPELEVNISATRLRACREATYYINYCNNGTDDAQNSILEIELPDYFSPTSFSTNYDSISGQNYYFKNGLIQTGECGNIVIQGTISCGAILGQTLCANAIISPNLDCEEQSILWDRSSIEVNGICNDTAACFTITNVSNNNMKGISTWRLYSNNMLAQQGSFKLNAGESRDFCFEPNGTSLRFEADQRPEHPGNSLPRAYIELCGQNNLALGYILQVSQDDIDNFVDVECLQIRGSFDPNDKTVIPRGITENNYITTNDKLEYTIRFQNTGNDTAFVVRIIDTLDTKVYKMNTLKVLSSSHDYSFELTNQGVAIWTFDNILLADSFTNEKESHGFVKFAIDQNNNNKGTVIKNRAAIYFDYNEPVITNFATNTINDTVISTDKIIQLGLNDNVENIKITVSPNPFSERAVFKINATKSELKLTVFDLNGKIIETQQSSINEFIIIKKGYQKGIYFYIIETEFDTLGSGKLIIHD